MSPSTVPHAPFNDPHIRTIRDTVVAELAGDERILAVYLLGSVAKGMARADSDIDIVVMPVPGETVTSSDLAHIAATLSYQLGEDVDSGEVSSRNLVYADEALHSGIRLYAKDADAAVLYSANLRGLYLEFNERRQEITNAYTV